MTDISIASAMLLWNSGLNGGTPACVVRPLGHSDYYDYGGSVGACITSFRALNTKDQTFQLLIEAWHVAAFYNVPIAMVHEALLVVPEYRGMLADDCLPKQFQHERD